MSDDIKTQYYEAVKRDFKELKAEYPFSSLTFLPTAEFSEASVKVVAVSTNLIEELSAEKDDFTGKFSRELRVSIPFDYQQNGCRVYGGSWIDLDKIKDPERHFHKKVDDGLQFCVGVPGSFSRLDNVLLENVRTAENMLIAYEQLLKGQSVKLNLNAYSHGDRGKNEYERDRKRYCTRN